MKLQLKHGKNPDLGSIGYWSEISRPKAKWVAISSFSEASKLCREYIDKYELGAGNWYGGTIIDDNGKKIARVSFNGRVWDNEDNEIAI